MPSHFGYFIVSGPSLKKQTQVRGHLSNPSQRLNLFGGSTVFKIGAGYTLNYPSPDLTSKKNEKRFFTKEPNLPKVYVSNIILKEHWLEVTRVNFGFISLDLDQEN